ncbi:uncharacterized protein [Ptychodera flava]|uniref:uncharacterized protein n=1 Tax=Ptychodera flava TaxID=63121 RepID=UPI00396AA276
MIRNKSADSISCRDKGMQESDDDEGGSGIFLRSFLQRMVKWESRGKPAHIMGVILATATLFILGTAMRGDWVLVLILAFKAWNSSHIPELDDIQENDTVKLEPIHEEPQLMEGVYFYVGISLVISFLTYYGMAWGLQYYYYIARRDRSHEWKCQPGKFLTKENERHEILLGSINMAFGATVSGILACYIVNGGYTTLYYKVSDYGLAYFCFSIPAVFMFVDAVSFYFHMGFHHPIWYKRIHKTHHRYKQPTAFSATAMNPIEFFLLQAAIVIPLFTVPVHPGVFIGILMYTYYYGMIDHSGIKMEALWPWQPSSMFHDNHHQYFHCNYGFNTLLFDWLHGTLRRKDRFYSEKIFGGRGAALKTE